jgi:GNAT superfamily N-acetyltransferase
MSLRDVIERVPQYAVRHGFRATLGRAWLAAKRGLSGGRMVLFVCDLDALPWREAPGLKEGQVERKQADAELSALDRQQIIGAWNPAVARKLMDQRFARGASLWLFKLDGQVAAHGWTLAGGTMEPHFFPFGKRDIHLFDFFVMPQYRGRGINPALVTHILAQMAAEKQRRAFIEAAEWNTAQLASLRKTPFRKLACARLFQPFGKPVVIWGRQKTLPEPPSAL